MLTHTHTHKQAYTCLVMHARKNQEVGILFTSLEEERIVGLRWKISYCTSFIF